MCHLRAELVYRFAQHPTAYQKHHFTHDRNHLSSLVTPVARRLHFPAVIIFLNSFSLR